jgi:hypothetical protein
MKFKCERTSGYREEKPCDEAVREVVITYDCRTLPKEQMAKKLKDERFLEYENFTFSDGRAGCRRKMEEDAYTVEIDNLEQLMDFVRKHGDIVIQKHDDYDLPEIEIYDTWRE